MRPHAGDHPPGDGWPRLVTFRDAGGRELFDLPDAPRPDPKTPAPVRFFARYDNVFISHDDRSRMAPDEFRENMTNLWLGMEAANVPKGYGRGEYVPLSCPMFSVDGFHSGTWRIARSKEEATLLVRPMVRLTDEQSEELAEEGRRMLEFQAGTALAGYPSSSSGNSSPACRFEPSRFDA